MGKLSLQHDKFVRQYVANSGNGKQAAIFAGYSVKSAENQAWKLLQKEHIRRAIEELKRQVYAENEITVKQISAGIRTIAENGKNDSDKLRAYELLGKYKGMFKDADTQVPLFQVLTADDIARIKAEPKKVDCVTHDVEAEDVGSGDTTSSGQDEESIEKYGV